MVARLVDLVCVTDKKLCCGSLPLIVGQTLAVVVAVVTY